MVASSAEPEGQTEGRSPKPRHANPAEVNTACEVVDDAGFWYSTARNSLYKEAGLLTVMRRSKEKPLSVPRFFQRMLPAGRAAPVASVVRGGITCPVLVWSLAPVHSIATAGLVIEEKSMTTAFFTHDGTRGG